jgi:hypothetical protein
MNPTTKAQTIYTFNTNTKIRLDKIIAIGSLDKDQYYNIFIPVYVHGMDKPIKLVMANSIGKVSDEIKQKVQSNYNDFLNAWEAYVYDKEK